MPPLGLDDKHPIDDPEFLISARAFEARKTAVAALGALKAIVTPVSSTSTELVCMGAQPGAMEYLTEKKTPDLLGEEEVHVDDLARKVDANPNMLGESISSYDLVITEFIADASRLVPNEKLD